MLWSEYYWLIHILKLYLHSSSIKKLGFLDEIRWFRFHSNDTVAFVKIKKAELAFYCFHHKKIHQEDTCVKHKVSSFQSVSLAVSLSWIPSLLLLYHSTDDISLWQLGVDIPQLVREHGQTLFISSSLMSTSTYFLLESELGKDIHCCHSYSAAC